MNQNLLQTIQSAANNCSAELDKAIRDRGLDPDNAGIYDVIVRFYSVDDVDEPSVETWMQWSTELVQLADESWKQDSEQLRYEKRNIETGEILEEEVKDL
jgi:hypothetical protein